MGFRQEHGKVLKLQVVQSLFGYIPFDERTEHEESFESACRAIMGKSWDDSGLSMESAEGLSHYLRGVASASGNPMRINNRNLMMGLARQTLSLESRINALPGGTLAGAIQRPHLEAEATALLKRYGLSALSTEGLVLDAAKFVGKTLVSLFLKKGVDKVVDKVEKAFDPKNVDWQDVRKMADHIEDTSFPFLKDGEQVEGKVSGEGIVKNLTWGKEFDEKDPVGFLKKKFAEWDKFYHAYEQAVGSHSKAVEADEKTTRQKVMAARDDDQKMRDILDAAREALIKLDNPAKVAARMKPVFPGARVMTVHKNPHGGYDQLQVRVDQTAKFAEKIRPLTTEEARTLLLWLRDTILGMKKYTTVFDLGRWSDHSDGDEFWDVTDHLIESDMYGAYIYWQSCEADFIYDVDDISEILAKLSNGIMNWVDRSFKTGE